MIFNPSAGRATPARLRQLDNARRILSDAGITTEFAATDSPGNATELARKAVSDNRQMVIACGGDGTFNEVVNGLAGSHVPLALLPAGTANVMAKELTLPWNVERAAALITNGQHRRVALGRVTTESGSRSGRYFLSVAGAGPDGAIVYAVHAGLKKSAGILAYWAEGFRQLARYDFPRFRAILDDQVIDTTLIVVGRTKHYGGPFRITTEADLYSDQFELMLCTTRSRWTYLRYLTMLCAGRLRNRRHTIFTKAETVRCEPIDAGKSYVQVDGEAAGCLPAEFSIVPDALTLVVPETMSNAKPGAEPHAEVKAGGETHR